MTGLLFALLIVVAIYMRSQSVDIARIVGDFKGEDDFFKQEEIAKNFVRETLWVMIIGITYMFYAPFVLMFSLNWLFGLELTYWWMFAVFILYTQIIKPRNS